MPVIKIRVSPWVAKRLNPFAKGSWLRRGNWAVNAGLPVSKAPDLFITPRWLSARVRKVAVWFLTNQTGLEKAMHLPQLLLGTCSGNPQLPWKRFGYSGPPCEETTWRQRDAEGVPALQVLPSPGARPYQSHILTAATCGTLSENCLDGYFTKRQWIWDGLVQNNR